jgi:hypothetical protein
MTRNKLHKKNVLVYKSKAWEPPKHLSSSLHDHQIWNLTLYLPTKNRTKMINKPNKNPQHVSQDQENLRVRALLQNHRTLLQSLHSGHDTCSLVHRSHYAIDSDCESCRYRGHYEERRGRSSKSHHHSRRHSTDLEQYFQGGHQLRQESPQRDKEYADWRREKVKRRRRLERSSPRRQS